MYNNYEQKVVYIYWEYCSELQISDRQHLDALCNFSQWNGMMTGVMMMPGCYGGSRAIEFWINY